MQFRDCNCEPIHLLFLLFHVCHYFNYYHRQYMVGRISKTHFNCVGHWLDGGCRPRERLTCRSQLNCLYFSIFWLTSQMHLRKSIARCYIFANMPSNQTHKLERNWNSIYQIEAVLRRSTCHVSNRRRSPHASDTSTALLQLALPLCLSPLPPSSSRSSPQVASLNSLLPLPPCLSCLSRITTSACASVCVCTAFKLHYSHLFHYTLQCQ